MTHTFGIFHSFICGSLRKSRRSFFPVSAGNLILLPVILLLFHFLPLSGATTPPKRILIINSYSSIEPWTRDLNAGFQEYLSKRKINAHYDYQELDVRGTLDVKPPLQTVRRLQELLKNTHYDLIVTNGNDAADLFFDGKLSVPQETPLLIINYLGDLMGKRPPNMPMTGVVSMIRPYSVVKLGLQLKPHARHAVIMAGASAEAREYQKRLRENAAVAPPVQLEILSGTEYSLKELEKKLEEMPEDTLLFFYSWSSVKEEFTDTNRTLRNLSEKFKGLILGRHWNQLDDGAAGGILSSGYTLGRRGGELAERIFSGERASTIPLQNIPPRKVLDYKALARYDIHRSDLPEDLELLNVPENFFRKYWIELLASGIVVLLLFQSTIFRIYYYKRMIRQVKGLVDKLPVRVAVLDLSGKVLFSHIPDPDEIVPQELTHLNQLGSLADRIRSELPRLADGSSGKIRLEYHSGDKDRQLTLVLLNDDSLFHAKAVVCVSVDVTELHEAHRQMALMAERFRLTLHSIGDAVIATDEEERITFMNPIAATLTGYAQEEVLGQKLQKIFNIISYRDEKPIESPLSRALNEGRIVELANHTDLISRSGKRYHIADSAAPIRDREGKISGGVLVFRDVTDEYEKRDKLRLNDLILENAGKMAKFSYFTCEPDGKLKYSRLGNDYWPEENGKPMLPERWIAPADLVILKEKWNALSCGDIEEFEVSYTTAPGHPRRHFEFWMRRGRNESSGKDEIFGVIQDITRLKENELRYRGNLQLLETIMNHLPGFIFVKNVDDGFRYLAGNRHFQALAKHSEDEIIGHTDDEIFREDTAAAEKFKKDDRTVLQSGQTLDTEEILHNDAKPRTVRTIKTIVKQPDGPRLLIGMGIDITRQSQLERERRKMITHLNQYINWERLTNQALTRILQENDFEKMVVEILDLIGRAAQADRCYIFRYLDETGYRTVHEHSWRRDGAASLAEYKKVEIDLHDFPATRARLSAGQECFYSADHVPPEGDWTPELRHMAKQHVYARMLNRIMIDGQPYGFIGLDYDRNNIPDGDYLQIIHNLTRLYQLAYERHRQNSRLADSAALQRQIVEKLSIPLTICDPDYDIVMINSKAREVCLPQFSEAWTNGNAGRYKCHDVSCGSKEPPEWCPARHCLLSGKECSVEHEFNGRHMLSSAQPLYDRNGKLRYILTSDIDLTDIIRQKEELRRAMEAAQAADRAKSMFLATMSHEIRTPLNAVLGFSDLLLDARLSAKEQTEYLQAIHLAGNSLLNLINDILDLSKLEAEQTEIIPAPTNLPELLHEVAAIFREKIREKHLDYRQEIPPRLPILELDRLRLRQILLNLLGNAVKFTENGSVSLTVTFEPQDHSRGRLRICVADTGIGIRKDACKTIFQPFIQQDALRDTHVYNGTGLGLAISHRLVQRMGGVIRLESRENIGSSFTVDLPGIVYHGDHKKTVEVEAESVVPAALENQRILIVDDVPINLKVLASMLKKSGAHPLAAASGEEALALLKQEKVDAVLTDLWMPGMNGAELAAAIHARPESAHLKIIAVTADVEAANNFPQQDFSAILLKPVTLKKLSGVLEKTKQ